jgi:hypothetical protein
MQLSTRSPKIPLPDRMAAAMFRRFPSLGQWLGDLETRTVRDEIAQTPVTQPVFVCGLARAGSTILLESLAQSGVFATHRYADYPLLWTPYWWNWLRARLPASAAVPAQRAHGDRIAVTRESPEAFEEILWMHFFEQRHDPHIDQRLDTAISNAAFEQFYVEHIRKLIAVRRAQRYLAKGNYNVARLKYLLRLFPDARFIVAVRDPVDHVASLCRQDALFDRWHQENAGIGRHLASIGHVEFGPQKHAENLGDTQESLRIQACFQQGRIVEGFARQWAGTYGHVLKQIAADNGLASAIRIVRYDLLCSEPEQSLAKTFLHAGLVSDEASRLANATAGRISAPSYYKTSLSTAEVTAVQEITNEVWQSIAKKS